MNCAAVMAPTTKPLQAAVTSKATAEVAPKAAWMRQAPPKASSGDEVHIIDGDEPLDYTDGPPGYAMGAAVIVRGESMRPTFDPGDMLFFRIREDPPAFKDLPARAVIVQVKDGPLYVKKLLPGTKRGRYHLLSVNPQMPLLQDQPVESIARIEWIKPTG